MNKPDALRVIARVEALKQENARLHAEVERLESVLTWEQNLASRVGTHGPGCHAWGPGHYLCLMRVNEELVAALRALVENDGLEAFSYLDKGIGVASEGGKRWLNARAALARVESK